MAATLCVNAVLLFVGFWTWPHPLTETPAATKKPVPTVYVVTPTHRQATQIPNLYRLAHALMLATNVFWVLVEDAVRPTKAVSRLLEECGIPHVHLLGPCPRSLRGKGRGVSARNAGIQWLQRNASQPGVVYFADDDNTYDHRIFDEIRRTEGVSVFPVGAMREKGLSTPVVHEGRVIGFYDPWFGGRIFPLDMAGFAVNLRLVVNNRDLRMPYETGYLETKFLEAVGVSSLADLEPLCDNATKVYAWHTKTKPAIFPSQDMINETFTHLETNLPALIDYMNSCSCDASTNGVHQSSPARLLPRILSHKEPTMMA
ncbi:galactosylgalactosylxylosylprotein 3-beta-glucuronosyltransferase S-like [Haemaphysalis longicornis]